MVKGVFLFLSYLKSGSQQLYFIDEHGWHVREGESIFHLAHHILEVSIGEGIEVQPFHVLHCPKDIQLSMRNSFVVVFLSKEVVEKNPMANA